MDTAAVAAVVVVVVVVIAAAAAADIAVCFMHNNSIDAKHVLREVRVMRYLGEHENIVTLEDLFCNHVRRVMHGNLFSKGQTLALKE